MRLFVLLLCVALTPCIAYGKANTENAFSPRQGATALVVKTLNGAKETICLAAYSFTSKPVAEALIAAYERGVDVRVVLDKSQETARKSLYGLLLDAEVPTRINRRYAIMHNKFVVVDDSTLQLGSFNYTKAAEEKNAENVLVIRRNKKVIESYSRQCDRLWDEAE
jgi:phosphatidylserine/phosphatidylglycerophosphate/cardiolipin synthase-like enzyme